METVTASYMWPGPDLDVLTLFVEPTPDWGADPIDFEICVYRVLDENEQYTDAVAGVEIVGFLDFDRWGDLPPLRILWRVPGWEALPLEDVLRRVQQSLRLRTSAVASSRD